jgi:hypothetical protein
MLRNTGLVVRAESSHPRGLNPVVYWMDVGEASYYIEKKKNKGS